MKFKVTKNTSYTRLYNLYVKKFFWWFYVDCFCADNINEAVEKGRDKAFDYKYATAEFEI